MTPKEVRAIVDNELEQGWNEEDSRANPQSIPLTHCLLTQPERHTYLDSWSNNRPVKMWLVLEEDPVNHLGYAVVFDETRAEFGLAVPQSEQSVAPRMEPRVFLGYYGSFRETLEGM